jgi:hypothetical protein
MSGPTKCYHCGNLTEDNGGMVWAIVRIAGYLDEFDVTLCATCTHRLFATLKHDARRFGNAVPDGETRAK